MTVTIAIVITFFVVLSIILWVWLSVVWWSLKNGIPPMPTSEKIKCKVLDFIPPETQGTIIDLGSGWGNVVVQLAKKFPHCHIVGYESSPIPYYFSRIWLLYAKLPNLRIHRKNFFDEDISNAALVYCYLYPGAMKQLREKFLNELKPGTIVFSNTFAVPDWEPVHVVSVKDLYSTRIYMYMKSSTNIDALHAKPDEGDKVKTDKNLMPKNNIVSMKEGMS